MLPHMRIYVDLCAYSLYKSDMPRVNIYLPNDVHELAERWRDDASLSEICARAIRDEFDAREVHRAPPALLEAIRQPTTLERALTDAYGLAEVFAVESGQTGLAIHEALGAVAAKYMDRNVCDDSLIAVAGGRQMWCTVRNLSPRRVRTTITALGLHHADPKVLHVHPNTLATFLWLLYSPRSAAYIIGSGAKPEMWAAPLESKDRPSYFVLSSCGKFDTNGSLAGLLGNDVSRQLDDSGAAGDYAYNFLNDFGEQLPVSIDAPQFTLAPKQLKAMSKRSDARVVLIAGGANKLHMINIILEARLCNVLITDAESANQLLRQQGGVPT